MDSVYGSEVYKVLYRVVKIKMAEYLLHSGLELQSFFRINNLVSKDHYYLLYMNGKELKFRNTYTFILTFTDFLKLNIVSLKKEYDSLMNQEEDEFDDDLSIERKYKEVWLQVSQQEHLLKALSEFQSKLDED